MLLAIDIGNTNLTIGFFIQSQLKWHWRLATDHKKMPDEYGLQLMGLLNHARIDPRELDGVAISSVVPNLTAKVLEACEQYLGTSPLVVESGIKTGIRILYEDPKTVGADRICDAVAVKRLYGGPACVIDFGTATTFNAINEHGDYLGGAITAGINLSAEALFTHAAKLPKIDLKRPDHLIGKNTTEAMRSGLLFGYVSMVEGMVKRFKNELGEGTVVIATGGLAELIARETDVIDHTSPWLTLEGLRMIWELNNLS